MEIGVSAIADEVQGLTRRRWSEVELVQYVLSRVDLEQFPKRDAWGQDIGGARYRLLAKRLLGDEGDYFFWDEEQKTVEKYSIDAVRSHGPEPLTADDVEMLRSIVTMRTR